MAGRIRTIKPELLEDAVTAGVSAEAFRLFIGMIVLADDYGRLRAEPEWLACQVFWKQRNIIPMEEIIADLSPLVLFYEVGGQRYAAIRNWTKHQKVNHPGKGRIPEPSQDLLKSSEYSSKLTKTLLPDHGTGTGRDLGRGRDPSERESLRGGPGPTDAVQPETSPPLPPPDSEEASRVDLLEKKILVDVSAQPDVFAAYIGAYTNVTGHKPVIAYEQSFQRELIRICAEQSGGLFGNNLVDWTRDKAAQAANAGAEASVFAFAKFLNATGTSEPKDAPESIYGAAIAMGRKAPYSCPPGTEALLRTTFRDQGYHSDGRRVAPERFAEWLAVEARTFAEWLSDRIKREPKAAIWYSNYDPKGFQKRLNEIGAQEAVDREREPILGEAS